MNISEVIRRDIIDYLLLRGYSFHGRLDLIDFLNRIWKLSSMPSTDHRYKNAEGDIRLHVLTFPDWDEHYLLYTYLGILQISDEMFIAFLESCVHSLVLSDENQVLETLSEFNKYLAPDGYRLEVSSYISGRSVYKAIRIDVKEEDKYEVVLSFAGEERYYVEKVAEYLKKNDIRVFYDKYEEVDLWGKDLAEHLDTVYRGSARYCVMFISKNYADKAYPTHERRSALAKAIEEKKEYILPVRFDNTEIPGLRPTIRYVDLSTKTPEQLGEMILQKLGGR